MNAPRRALQYTLAALKWLPAAVLTGLVCGAAGVVFHFAIRWAQEFRAGHGWVLYLLPVGAIVIALWYGLLRLRPDPGTNRVIEAAKDMNDDVPLTLAPGIFGATVLTQFFGGSAGREGAALQLGGSLGCALGRLLRLSPEGRRLMIVCGMSAVFSALFGTPVGAVMFVLEVLAVGHFRYAALVPCMTASLTAYLLNLLAGAERIRLTIAAPTADSVVGVLQTVVLGVLCALVSILFVVAVHKCEHVSAKLLKNPCLRAAVLGAMLLGATLLLGTQTFNGAGMDYVEGVIEGGESDWYDFVLKLAFTAVTLAAGYKGGEIVPTFFVGAAFGAAAGPLLGMDANLAAAIGMIAVFCGVVNCPIASMVLAIEIFGGGHLTLFAVACALSYVFSGYFGLYRTQSILDSKIGPEEHEPEDAIHEED